MGGAGAQRELFKAIIEHCIPLIKKDKVACLSTWAIIRLTGNGLRAEISQHQEMIQTHFIWDDTQAFADQIRSQSTRGLHVFLHDNTFHAVYATNYLMRVVDVMITKPSELAFYPVPKIFNASGRGSRDVGRYQGSRTRGWYDRSSQHYSNDPSDRYPDRRKRSAATILCLHREKQIYRHIRRWI